MASTAFAVDAASAQTCTARRMRLAELPFIPLLDDVDICFPLLLG